LQLLTGPGNPRRIRSKSIYYVKW